MDAKPMSHVKDPRLLQLFEKELGKLLSVRLTHSGSKFFQG